MHLFRGAQFAFNYALDSALPTALILKTRKTWFFFHIYLYDQR